MDEIGEPLLTIFDGIVQERQMPIVIGGIRWQGIHHPKGMLDVRDASAVCHTIMEAGCEFERGGKRRHPFSMPLLAK
jgi:hypothetical protein